MQTFRLSGDVTRACFVEVDAESLDEAVSKAEAGEFVVTEEVGKGALFKFDGTAFDAAGHELTDSGVNAGGKFHAPAESSPAAAGSGGGRTGRSAGLLKSRTCPSLQDEYYRLRVQGEAPEAVRRHDGRIMQRFTHIDNDAGVGLASLAGRPDEGVGVRVPEGWLVPLTPPEVAHARWLARTFFERERYVNEDELAKILCASCKGSGLVAEVDGHVILVTREHSAAVAADGATVSECGGCHGLGVAGPDVESIMRGGDGRE